MGRESNPGRKLVDITLDEAVQVIRLGEGHSENIRYKLRRKENPFRENFTQLFYKDSKGEVIAANFFDGKDAVTLCQGNSYYRTFYGIVKYLEKQGFDLESANCK